MSENKKVKRGGGFGFIMGMAAGIGSVLLYIAGKERKLGDKVADGIEHFEDKAKDVKDKAAHKAVELKDATVEKLHAGKEKVVEAVKGAANGHKGEEADA